MSNRCQELSQSRVTSWVRSNHGSIADFGSHQFRLNSLEANAKFAEFKGQAFAPAFQGLFTGIIHRADGEAH